MIGKFKKYFDARAKNALARDLHAEEERREKFRLERDAARMMQERVAKRDQIAIPPDPRRTQDIQVFNGSSWDRQIQKLRDEDERFKPRPLESFDSPRFDPDAAEVLRRQRSFASSAVNLSEGPSFSPLETELLKSGDPQLIEMARELLRERYMRTSGTTVTF